MAHARLIILLVLRLLQSVSCDNDADDYEYADDSDDYVSRYGENFVLSLTLVSTKWPKSDLVIICEYRDYET